MLLKVRLEALAQLLADINPPASATAQEAADAIQHLCDALRHILDGSLSLPRFAEKEAAAALARVDLDGPA